MLLAVAGLGVELDALDAGLRLDPGGGRPGGLDGGPVAPVGRHALDRLDLDADGDRLVGPAFPDAAVGGDVGVVAADGDLDVVVADERAAGRVDVDPAAPAGPDLAPGVGGHLAGLVDVAADVAGRQADAAAGRQEQVGEILADPAAQPQGFADRRPRGRHLLLVDQARPRPRRVNCSDHVDQPALGLRPGRRGTRRARGSGFTSGLGWRYSSVSSARPAPIGRPGRRRPAAISPRAARCVRTIDRRPDDQLAVGRQDVEQVDPIAEPVAIRS